MIEPSAATANPDIASAAQRRVFHSKVDTIRPTYAFEDVSLAPGTDTIEPADVELGQTFCGIDLAILVIEGVQTRYDDPDEVLARIAAAVDADVQDLLAEIYRQPVREDLIARRLDEIHGQGSRAAVAATPSRMRTL